MGIAIYKKACVIKRDGLYHFMLYRGSSNDWVNGGQRVIGEDFRGKWLRASQRSYSWKRVAVLEKREDMARTVWNAPTSVIYGRIAFGNKRNIAKYWMKCKVRDYASLDSAQQSNMALLSDKGTITNADDKPMLETVTYCGRTFEMKDYSLGGFWDLDNL